jgi:hypothetical protein
MLQSILIRDDVQIAEQSRAVKAEAIRRARRMGKWLCPGKCGRMISANVELCWSCTTFGKEVESGKLV